MVDAPPDYMTAMIENVVGFTIDIDRVLAKSKLSQNRGLEDFSNVTSHLEARALRGLSARMRKLQD